MSDPRFLTVHHVELLHQCSIERYGGTLGLRDRGGLEAATNQPKNTYFYARGDLYDIAAAYAFHIAQAQAFLDGNKRTAVAAAFAFLELNGVAAEFDQVKVYDAMIGIAERAVTKSDLAALLRNEQGGRPA